MQNNSKRRMVCVTKPCGNIIWLNAANIEDVYFNRFEGLTIIALKDNTLVKTTDSPSLVLKLAFE